MQNKVNDKIKYPLKINHSKKKSCPTKRRPYKTYKWGDFDFKKILEEALILYETEKNYVEIIAKKYGIIEGTLRDKLLKYKMYGDSSIEDNRGKSNNIFTDEEEKSLSDYIKTNFIDKQLPFDNGDLKILAVKQWNKFKDDGETKFTASDGWCTTFKHKWGLSSVSPSNKKREKENNNEEEINKFQKECVEELAKVGTNNFYNYDETFWRVINFTQSTFGYTGADSTTLTYLGNEKLGLTAGYCINAYGDFLKPIIIKKGKTKKCLVSLNCSDTYNGIACYSNNGWINNGIMIILLDMIREKSKNANAVLLLDQYPIHTNEYVAAEANKRKIKLIFIPSRLTWKYQPLDVGINGILKSSARKLWKEERLSNPNNIPKLSDGVRHMASAINKVITANIIKKSFYKSLTFIDWKKQENDEKKSDLLI